VIKIRDDSPRWKEINASAWVHERAGLRHIKTLLPDADPYFAWANVEFVAPDGSVNEVDLLVLTPSGLHLLELKHWQGEISGDGSQWVVRSPNGHTRRTDNPLILANRKAKRLASLLQHYGQQSGKRVRVPFIRAAIFLHAANTRARLDEVGRQWVYGLQTDRHSGLPGILTMLTQQPTDQRDLVDRARAREIVGLVDGAGIRPSIADRTVLQLLLNPKLYAEGQGWQDYLAGHKLDTSVVRRVRFYLTSKASPDDRDTIQRAAEREFRLLQGIHHPGIAHATDLVDHEFGPAVIFEHDPDAVRFDHWLAEHGDRLTVEDRLNLARDLAEIVRYAHSRHLVHRGLNPRSILVCDPDKPHPRLVITDWQTGGRAGTSTTQSTLLGGTQHLDQLADEMTRLYQAPELATNPDAPGHLLDVFGLGALTYLIFTGHPPASSAAQLRATIAERGGLELTAAADGVPDTLAYLVYDATAGDTAKRTQSVAAFLSDLDEVEDELTAPEPGPVIDPLEARAGDVLDGGLVVVDRLGSGATAVGLLVRRQGDDTPLVLKVARDEDKRRRLLDEGERLRGLRHWQVAQLVGEPETVGGRTALLLEFAGAPTLTEELQTHGRLSLELLERYGRDLLDIVAYLDGQGVTHRDIKPANLAARPRPKDRQKHLCIFDFSLTATPADQLGAGTPQYLDPFLGPPRRPRFDLAAERFAAAVTLYEMATGTLPRWGDGIANPATIPDEVTITPQLFDPAVADRLGVFFGRALARDARERFDTIEEMADAWRLIFKDVEAAAPERPGAAPAQLATRDTPVDLVGLTARARSALERLGVRTVGDLVDYDAMALSRQDGIPQATKTEIRRRAKELRAHVTPQARPETVAEPAAEELRARSVDSLVELLVPRQTTRNRSEVAALRVMLGQEPAGEDHGFLYWPAQAEAAAVTGTNQSQLSRMMANRAQRWADDEDLAQVRDEIVELLDESGGVMSAAELAQALIGSRGTVATEPRRTAQAVGLVRAAVEAELSLGGDARVGARKFGTEVLVGREPDDPTATHTSEDLLRYAVLLGRVAQKLAAADPLPTPSRAIERLRHTTAPSAMPELSDARLVQLAAAAAAGDVAVNAQLQLYPVGMAAERAIRLAAGSLVLTRDQTLTVENLRNRVAARFLRATPVPDRPALDRLLAACGVALEWDQRNKVYRAPAATSGSLFATSTRIGTVGALVPTGTDAAADAQTRLTAALDRAAFLALLVAPPDVTRARRALLDALPLTEVDVTRLLVETLRSIGVPWELVLNSDAQPPNHPDRRNLENAVRHEVLPRVSAAIDAAPGAVLLTEAAPLARYGCMDLLARLADNGVPRPAARLLLAAARRPQPVLDTEPIPVTSAAQWMWLPEPWYNPTVQRSPTKDIL
jgi:serine/threonine protein kinase